MRMALYAFALTLAIAPAFFCMAVGDRQSAAAGQA
jgi:hypothetical protein